MAALQALKVDTVEPDIGQQVIVEGLHSAIERTTAPVFEKRREEVQHSSLLFGCAHNGQLMGVLMQPAGFSGMSVRPRRRVADLPPPALNIARGSLQA
jgi:hypothetical protein